MKGFKDPGYQDRVATAARAKAAALEKLKAAPKPDAAELAARAARGLEREAEAERKRAAAREAREAAERARGEAAVAAEKALAAAAPPVLTEEELKAARDARYAARKKRKG
jgi:hypothetical protein